jgi:hypothetical protein
VDDIPLYTGVKKNCTSGEENLPQLLVRDYPQLNKNTKLLVFFIIFKSNEK